MNTFIEIPASKQSLDKRTLVFGRGVNNSNYMSAYRDATGKRIVCPYYRSWTHMLERCYCPKLHKRRVSYIDCEVVESWLLFSNFKKWMKKQDWKGKDLDKDIKFPGNKIYSPDTCLFVSSEINKLLNKNSVARGKYPLGVCSNKKGNRFISACRVNGHRVSLGSYSTPEEAHSVYKEFKKRRIESVANLPENKYIQKYLIKHACLLN